MPSFFDDRADPDGILLPPGFFTWKLYDSSLAEDAGIHRRVLSAEALRWRQLPPYTLRYRCDNCGSKRSLRAKELGPPRWIRGTVYELDQVVLCARCWWERFGDEWSRYEELRQNWINTTD